MPSSGTHLRRQQPELARLCLHVLLILGIFGMHQLMADSIGEPGDHGNLQTVSATVAGDVSVMLPDNGGSADGLADCCGAAMLCAAMLLGIGAYIAVRRQRTDWVLWQLPTAFTSRSSRPEPRFPALTKMQRLSVIRC